MVRVRGDQAFASEEWRALWDRHQIESVFSPPREPNSRGIVERIHGTLGTVIARMLAEKGGWADRDMVLAAAVAAVNRNPRSDGGPSAYEAMFGQQPKWHTDVALGLSLDDPLRPGEELAERAARTAAGAIQALMEVRERRWQEEVQRRGGGARVAANFKVGDVVWLLVPINEGDKLQRRMDKHGPFRIGSLTSGGLSCDTADATFWRGSG